LVGGYSINVDKTALTSVAQLISQQKLNVVDGGRYRSTGQRGMNFHDADAGFATQKLNSKPVWMDDQEWQLLILSEGFVT
jgi:hypothetical protein